MADPKYIELQRFLKDRILDDSFLNNNKIFLELARPFINEVVQQMFNGELLFAGLGNEPYETVTKRYGQVGLAHYYLSKRRKTNTDEMMFETLELVDLFMGTTRSELLFSTLEKPDHINIAKVIKLTMQLFGCIK